MGKLSLKLKKTTSKGDGKEKPASQTSIQTFFSKSIQDQAAKQSPLLPCAGSNVEQCSSQLGASSAAASKIVADDSKSTGCYGGTSEEDRFSDNVIEATPTKDNVIEATPTKETVLVADTPDENDPSSDFRPLSSHRKLVSLRRKRSLPSSGSPPMKQRGCAKSPANRVCRRLPSVTSDSAKCALLSQQTKGNPFAVSSTPPPAAKRTAAAPLDILSQYASKREPSAGAGAGGMVQSPVRTHGEPTDSGGGAVAMPTPVSSRHRSLIERLEESRSPQCSSATNAVSGHAADQAANGSVSGGYAGNCLADSSIADDELMALYGQMPSSMATGRASNSPIAMTAGKTSNSPTPTSTAKGRKSGTPPPQHLSPVLKRRKISECDSPTRPACISVVVPSTQHGQARTSLFPLLDDAAVPGTPQKSAVVKAGATPVNSSLTADDYAALLESCVELTPVKASPTKSCAAESAAAEDVRGDGKHSAYQRFLVLEVYTRDATVSSGQASWNVSEKVLRLLDERRNVERQCLLRDDWLQTTVDPGDIVHVSGSFTRDGLCLLSNGDGYRGYLVVQPDTLISTTSVAMATRCLRRAVLGDRFKGGGSDITEALLVGVMIHEVFDLAMKAGNFSVDYTRKVSEQLSQRQDYLHMMYAAQQTQASVMEKIVQQLATLQEWSSKYLHKQPKTAQGLLDMTSTFQSPSDEKHSLAISKLQDIEENIWSPRFGLKGKVDATVEVKIHKRRPLGGKRNKPTEHVPAEEKLAWSRVPLELKTGRQTASLGTVDHRAQVILYTMMLSDAHATDVAAGLLLYSKTGKMLSVPAQDHELRALLLRRNELARYLGLERSSSSAWTASRGAGLLPPTLHDEHTCKYCPQLATCALLHRSVENGTTESSGMGSHFEESTSHVSPEHLTFFADWYRLVGLEASCASADNSLRNIWTFPAEERMAAGQCFGNLCVDKTELGGGSSSWRTRFTMSRRPGQSDSDTVPEVAMGPGDMIVLSEQNGRVALCTGFLLDVGLNHVEITADRQLPRHGANGEAVLYCIDSNSGLNPGGALWGNLAHLFIAAEDRDSRLRSLIVDLSPPRFARSSILTRASLLSQSTQSQLPCTFSAKQFQLFSAQADQMDQIETILDTLNSDQHHAIDRALCAQDYALILGMPGTGKTTTIACLVQILVLCGKRVLLASYTHSAVDTILLKLIKNGVDFIRLGKQHKVHSTVHPYLSDVACSEFSTVSQLEKFYSSKRVMATTCHGIGHAALSRQSFDVCIVDEASQITMPMCFGPIRLAETFVLVGDQYQLPPLVQSSLAREGGMSVSLFRRLAEAHPAGVTNLQHQYRMHQDLMLLSNTLVYSHRLKCGTDEVATKLLPLPNWSLLSNSSPPSADWLLKTLAPQQPVVFLNTDKVPGTEQTGSGLVYNDVEASLVGLIVKSLLKAGVAAPDVGVISIYRQQLKVISRLLQRLDSSKGSSGDSLASSGPSSSLRDIEVNTVDRYQGRDKPCVIVSLVRSNTGGKVGQLLLDWRRANVAVTRAKHKLILIGSASTLRRSHLFKLLLDLVQEHNWLIDAPASAHLNSAA